ncbi:MAG: hypothetical protein PGN16_03985 [Sphingomonas phyllosphaerae]|uniref:hypothetical protein n=1 Tax=Sphingomonas phyllosphaerae TaxID=257003 RepID=UPI002FF5F4AD
MVDKLEAGEAITELQARWARAAAYLSERGWPEDHDTIGYPAVVGLLAGYERIHATPTEDARERVKVLEEALEAIRDGDVPRPVHCHWRADGKPSKLDECKHGVTMSEDCAGCTAEFIDTALGNKETDHHG